MADRWTDRLSEYLDGDLDAREHAELEQHLAGCDDCVRTLDELRAVVRHARSLGGVEPPQEVWAAVAARIGAAAPQDVVDLGARRRAQPRRFSFSVPQLAAAAVVLMLMSSGTALVLTRGGADAGLTAAAPETAVRTVALDPRASEAYDRAVTDLERVLAENRERLEPETVQALESSLGAIDRAIAEARAALARDPSSEYLNTYLADRMRHKLSLLREATSIVRAET